MTTLAPNCIHKAPGELPGLVRVRRDAVLEAGPAQHLKGGGGGSSRCILYYLVFSVSGL